MLRDRARARNRERQEAGLCLECGKPSEIGQRRCLGCRVVKHENSLPNPVRNALNEYREREKQAKRNEHARSVREFIDRHLHLISKPRTREILRMRYGYTESTCQTLEQVANRLGITRERVRQIQEAAEGILHVYTIEKDVPLPTGRFSGKKLELHDTLKAMSVGDSFVMPRAGKDSALSQVAKSLGYIVTTRSVSNAEKRVWLVSKNGDAKSSEASHDPNAAQHSPASEQNQ